MVPSESRRRRHRLPLGKAARTIRAVSSGTGSMVSGFMDMGVSFLVRSHEYHPLRAGGGSHPTSSVQGPSPFLNSPAVSVAFQSYVYANGVIGGLMLPLPVCPHRK